MKNYLHPGALGALLLAGLLNAATLNIDWTKPQTRTLAWDYDAPSPDISFNIYASTNVNVPLTSWALLTNVQSTNLTVKTTTSLNGVSTNTYFLEFPQVPQLQFFVARTVSKFYGGESDFSNVTNTPPPPFSSQTFRVQ